MEKGHFRGEVFILSWHSPFLSIVNYNTNSTVVSLIPVQSAYSISCYAYTYLFSRSTHRWSLGTSWISRIAVTLLQSVIKLGGGKNCTRTVLSCSHGVGRWVQVGQILITLNQIMLVNKNWVLVQQHILWTEQGFSCQQITFILNMLLCFLYHGAGWDTHRESVISRSSIIFVAKFSKWVFFGWDRDNKNATTSLVL